MNTLSRHPRKFPRDWRAQPVAWSRWTRLAAACVVLVATACGTAPAQEGATVSEEVLRAQDARIAAIAKAKKSAVSVFGPGGGGGGSGVVVTPDGYALTNFHVVRPAGNHMKCSMPDGVLYDAVIVSVDPTGDVALIKLLGRDDFPAAELGDSDELRVGDWCFAVGNPFLLATDFQPTVTYGIVSGVHRYQYPAGTLLEYADCIQTDASINPGNSGGPLYNDRGQLVGINGRGSFEKRGRVNVGVGYAISINQIKHFMGYLRSGRIVDHATLGATVSSDDDGRVIVSNILESADAYRRGLRYGDEIVRFGGREITTVNGFKNALGIYPKGWRIPLTYRRDGEDYTTMVRLAGVHRREELLAKVQKPAQPRPQPKPGEQPKPAEPKPGEQPKPGEPKPGDQPKPIPVRPGGRPQPPPVPPEAAKMLVMRPGYSNYYFNKLNLDRVWNAARQQGDYADATGTWVLKGVVAAGGGEFSLRLGDDELTGSFPNGEAKVDLSRDLDQQLAPAGSGGMLPALAIWRRLLTVGPDKFGDVYYLGTAPVLGSEQLHDVLVGTFQITETRFSFSPETGLLTCLEMSVDADVDPCEVYFRDYRKVDDRMLPHTIEVRYGDQLFGEFKLEDFSILTPKAAP